MVPVAKGVEEVAMGGEFYTENLNLSWNRRRRRWDGKEGGIVAAAAGRETGRWEGGGEAHRSRRGNIDRRSSSSRSLHAHHAWRRRRQKCKVVDVIIVLLATMTTRE